jgi:ubiquitin-protein ligase
MSASFLKRINKEIQLYKKDNFSFPNLILQPSDNLNIWYFIIHDLKDTDYEGGIFLGKVILPDKYPFKAPEFIFLTENGRFEVNKKICTSFSGFHPELYSPSWNILSMLTGLVSFINDDQDSIESKGIGGILTTKEEKQKICQDSVEKIKENEVVLTYFKDFFDILKLN